MSSSECQSISCLENIYVLSRRRFSGGLISQRISFGLKSKTGERRSKREKIYLQLSPLHTDESTHGTLFKCLYLSNTTKGVWTPRNTLFLNISAWVQERHCFDSNTRLSISWTCWASNSWSHEGPSSSKAYSTSFVSLESFHHPPMLRNWTNIRLCLSVSQYRGAVQREYCFPYLTRCEIKTPLSSQ